MKPIILKNPVLQECLNKLRDKSTISPDFRLNLRYAGYYMTYEIIGRECSTEEMELETMYAKAKGQMINENILQIMVMRAGEPLAEGGARLLDEIKAKRLMGVVDAKRVEGGDGRDFKIVISSFKVPKFDENTVVIIYDTMLATASTLNEIIRKIKTMGVCKKMIVCSVVGSAFGMEKIEKNFPDVQIYCLAIDSVGNSGLNEKGFIIPGLGDAGDKAFGSYSDL